MIGRLNQFVTFTKKGKGRLPNGQPNNQWVDLFSDWASVVAVRGVERFEQGHDVSKTRYKLTMRHRADIDNCLRVNTDSGELEVLDAYPLFGKKDYIELTCQSV